MHSVSAAAVVFHRTAAEPRKVDNMTIRKHGTHGIGMEKITEYRTIKQKGGRMNGFIPDEELIEVCNNCPYDECRYSDRRTIMRKCYEPYMEVKRGREQETR